MSLLSGIRARNASRKIAKGIEQRGEADARLRRIRAEQLLGQIRAATASRGFRLTSQTHIDLEREAAFLEGSDIDRIKYRAEVEAGQARLEGDAALAQSISSTFSSLFSAAQLGFSATAAFKAHAATQVTSLRPSVGPTLGTFGGRTSPGVNFLDLAD